MSKARLRETIVVTKGSALDQQVLRCFGGSNRVAFAEGPETLLEILSGSSGSTLLLNLALFDQDAEQPVAKRIFTKACDHKIIVFTDVVDRDDLYKLFRQGVRGFCQPRISDAMLVKAVKSVADGELWIGRKLIGYLMARMILEQTGGNGSFRFDASMGGALTPREVEIARHVAKGKCDKIIARELDISHYTVKNHLRRIFDKLNIADRYQLALIYHGIELH